MESKDTRRRESNLSLKPFISDPSVHSMSSSKQYNKKGKKVKHNDFLVENDFLHKSDSSLHLSNKPHNDQQRIEMSLKKNSFHLAETVKDTEHTNFSEDMRKVALSLATGKNTKKEETKNMDTVNHIDYVLVYSDGAHDSCDKNNSTMLPELRNNFERIVELEGLALVKKKRGKLTFIIVTCSFARLCQEAEAVSLKMPLAGFQAPDGGPVPGVWKHFQTDDEVDLVSAPFCTSKKEIYEGIEDPDTFFRPALRSLLVHHILINLNLREKSDISTWSFHRSSQGLAYMLMHGVYTDALCVHSPSRLDPMFAHLDDEESVGNTSFLSNISDEKPCDPRKALNDTWLRWKKFQPLWKIRNYFGEKVALYFAWLGLLVSSLWIPMVIGLGVALWGFTNAIEEDKTSNDTLSVGDKVQGWMRDSFDNNATPFFALIICLWGTIFLELWKRKTAELAYQWDVSDFEEREPNRPQFYGTKVEKDPITGDNVWVYPFAKKYWKFAGSFSVLLFMVCLVIATTVGIIIYRVVSRVDIFDREGSIGPTLASVTSSFLNTVCIMVMANIYQRVAIILTDWENHQTQTSYDDALIVKLFAFQFVNSYASLYYIAFFRGSTNDSGVLDKGVEYSDGCGANNDCMTMLSLQVAMLMIMKPIPKLFFDSILPWLYHLWQKGISKSCCWCCRNRKVHNSLDVSVEEFLKSELEKSELGDFTLSEYNEKVIQYGFLMLFAAAFPLAPLIALLTNMFDLRVDAKRLLWSNRRPVAFRAEDIGMWYSILQFLNVVGVVTNAFLVAFTSQYGRNWEGDSSLTTVSQTLFNSTGNHSTVSKSVSNVTIIYQTVKEQMSHRSKLWLIIGFECGIFMWLVFFIIFQHIVFAVKFLIAMVIPDVPSHVVTAQRREKYHVDQLLEKARVSRGPGRKPSEPLTTSQKLKDSAIQTESNEEHEIKSPKDLEMFSPMRNRRHKERKTKRKRLANDNDDSMDVVRHEELKYTNGLSAKLAPLPSGYKASLPAPDDSPAGVSMA